MTPLGPVNPRTDLPSHPDEPAAAMKTWPPGGQHLAMVLWPSFLAAGMATMLLFAWVDPLALEDCVVPGALLGDRLAGYGLGFFCFWGITASSSAITLYLVTTLRSRTAAPK